MVDPKIERFAANITEKLSRLMAFANPTYPTPVTRGYDSNGDLYLNVTEGANTWYSAVIQFKPTAITAANLNAVTGLTQKVFTPHITRVIVNSGTQASATATLLTAVATNAVTIQGTAFTAVASGATGNQWNIGGSDTISAANLAAAINGSVTAGIAGVVRATSLATVVTIYSVQPGLVGNAITLTKTGAPITVTGAGFLAGGLNNGIGDATHAWLDILVGHLQTAVKSYTKYGAVTISDLADETYLVATFTSDDIWGELVNQ